MVEIEGVYDGIARGRYLLAEIYGENAAVTDFCANDLYLRKGTEN